MKFVTRRIAAIAVALSLLMPTTAAFAQEQDFEPDFYESQLSGWEITVSGRAFEITAADLEHYSTGEGEVITIETDLSSAEVSFFDDADTPDESIDIYLDGLETVADDFVVADRGTEGDLSYAVVSFSYETIPFIYYVQVTEDVVGNVDLFEALLAPEEAYAGELTTAQDEIAIDGDPFMDNVDADELVDRAGNPESAASPAATPTTPDEETPAAEADDVNESEVSADPREGAVLESRTESTPAATEATTDLSNVGTLTDSSWIGPIFEREISWDDPWTVDLSQDGVIVSDEVEQFESLFLTSADYSSVPLVYLVIQSAGDSTPDAYLEYWTSDEFLQGQGDDGAELLTSRSSRSGVAVVVRYSSDGVDYVMVRQLVELEDGTQLMLLVDASPEEISAVYDDMYANIALDGDELPQVLTPSQLERALGE